MITKPSWMNTIPYFLWETEIVADEYMDGGVVLIRTKDGWRAFLGSIDDEILKEIENKLEQNVYDFERSRFDTKRETNISKGLQNLLSKCGYAFPGYSPLRFVNEFRKRENG